MAHNVLITFASGETSRGKIEWEPRLATLRRRLVRYHVRLTIPRSRLVMRDHVIESAIDPDHLVDDLLSHKAQFRRQDKHWKKLLPLFATVQVHVTPFRDVARALVARVLVRGRAPKEFWRIRQQLFGWDEALFVAVFGAIGVPTTPTVLPKRANPAFYDNQPLTFEGAWSEHKTRVIEIKCSLSQQLAAWCCFEDLDHTKLNFNGCAVIDQSMRIVVELAAVLVCNTSRRLGVGAVVEIFVSTAVVNSKRNIRWPVMARWDAEKGVRTDLEIKTAVLQTFDDMLDAFAIDK